MLLQFRVSITSGFLIFNIVVCHHLYLKNQNITCIPLIYPCKLPRIILVKHSYKNAERLFKEAMKSIQGDVRNVILPSKWEALLNNLGHTCRKMKKYDEALQYHQQALVLDPLNPSTYSSIGFIHALMGNIQEAVDAFHRALGLRRDDTFTATMLGYVMEQLIDEAPPYPGTWYNSIFTSYS